MSARSQPEAPESPDGHDENTEIEAGYRRPHWHALTVTSLCSPSDRFAGGHAVHMIWSLGGFLMVHRGFLGSV